MKIRNFLLVIAALAAFWCFYSCNPTKKLSEGEYLLDKNAVVNKYATLDKSEIETYIKQKPNRKLLFWRFYLYIYNSIDQSKLDKLKIKRKAKREEENTRTVEK